MTKEYSIKSMTITYDGGLSGTVELQQITDAIVTAPGGCTNAYVEEDSYDFTTSNSRRVGLFALDNTGDRFMALESLTGATHHNKVHLFGRGANGVISLIDTLVYRDNTDASEPVWDTGSMRVTPLSSTKAFISWVYDATSGTPGVHGFTVSFASDTLTKMFDAYRFSTTPGRFTGGQTRMLTINRVLVGYSVDNTNGKTDFVICGGLNGLSPSAIDTATFTMADADSDSYEVVLAPDGDDPDTYTVGYARKVAFGLPNNGMIYAFLLKHVGSSLTVVDTLGLSPDTIGPEVWSKTYTEDYLNLTTSYDSKPGEHSIVSNGAYFGFVCFTYQTVTLTEGDYNWNYGEYNRYHFMVIKRTSETLSEFKRLNLGDSYYGYPNESDPFDTDNGLGTLYWGQVSDYTTSDRLVFAYSYSNEYYNDGTSLTQPYEYGLAAITLKSNGNAIVESGIDPDQMVLKRSDCTTGVASGAASSEPEKGMFMYDDFMVAITGQESSPDQFTIFSLLKYGNVV